MENEDEMLDCGPLHPATAEQQEIWRQEEVTSRREYEARQAEERSLSRRSTALHLAVTAMHHDNDPTLIAAAAEVFDAFLRGKPAAEASH